LSFGFYSMRLRTGMLFSVYVVLPPTICHPPFEPCGLSCSFTFCLCSPLFGSLDAVPTLLPGCFFQAPLRALGREDFCFCPFAPPRCLPTFCLWSHGSSCTGGFLFFFPASCCGNYPLGPRSFFSTVVSFAIVGSLDFLFFGRAHARQFSFLKPHIGTFHILKLPFDYPPPFSLFPLKDDAGRL